MVISCTQSFRKESERHENDDVSNAYLPGMYHDWVFAAHHPIRQSLTRRTLQPLPGSFRSPRFFFNRISSAMESGDSTQ